MTSSPAESLTPPRGGTPPPDSIRLPDGTPCFLAPLAWETARRHWEEFPDERERYGEAGFEWCVHDTQWLLGWAAKGLLERHVPWLANVLRTRGYPLDRLRRALEIAADVVADTHGDAAAPLARALRAGTAFVPR